VSENQEIRDIYITSFIIVIQGKDYYLDDKIQQYEMGGMYTSMGILNSRKISRKL
jgi:hypothetical protein